MVENIKKMVRERMEDSGKMFDLVVNATVSEHADPSKIQDQIAGRLDLKLEKKTLEIRAELLHTSLKKTQSVLIILDDVWERLNLQKIGIPSQSTHPGCKLILTSRDRKAITSTAEEAKIFPLEVLDEKEAWDLFRKNAGDSIDSPDLHQIAKQVAEECKGLPLALETIGSALKGESKPCWKDALLELRQSMPGNIPNVLKDVYSPLSVSFNKLERKEHRYLFLLCCLFPEDYTISHEELVRYGMGLGIFDGVEDLSQARNRVEMIATNLISRSLLIKDSDEWGNPYVKMHDVIRDVGIYTNRQEFLISHGKEEWPNLEKDSYGNYSCFSLIFPQGEDVGVPECIDCPKLELLRMGCLDGDLEVPKNLFTGARGLKVLDVWNIKSLPSSINLLKGLQTLCLYSCELGMISVIGELKNLEILCLEGCVSIEELPEDIGGLKKLRKFEVIDCGNLVRIAFGVLSGLVRLEELIIVGSFEKWKAKEENETKNNASLVELDSLRHLTTLCIQISNPNAIPERLPHWVHKLKKYSITVARDARVSDSLRFHKFVSLGDVVTLLRDWFYDNLVRDAQSLELEGSNCTYVVNKYVPSRYQNLTFLQLYKCDNIKYLSYAVIEGGENGAIFPVLKGLKIEDCCSLEEICNGPPPAGSFKALEEIVLQNLSELMHLWTFSSEQLHLPNLKSVQVTDCQSLLHLFPLSVAESLSNLEELEVSNCPVLEEMFKREDEETKITMNETKFPKLDILRLENLSSLRGFCTGVDGVEIPQLSNMTITDLPGSMKECDNSVQQQFLFDQQVASNVIQSCLVLNPFNNVNFNFGGLQELRIECLHNVKSLFSPSVLSHFPNLKYLSVQNCWMLEEVIGKEEIDDVAVGETKAKTILFPHLMSLFLIDLPELFAFCHTVGDLELPLLGEVQIINCPRMETFAKPLSDVSLSKISNSKYVNQSFFAKEVLCPGLTFLYLEGINAAGIFHESIPNDRFCGLKHLEVIGCHRITNLLSSHIFRGLTKVQQLIVNDCKELQEVIAKEDHQHPPTNIIKETLFPQLKILKLGNLPKMQKICHVKNGLELPLLEEVTIEDCHMLETFSLGSLHLPRFKQLFGLLDPDFAAKIFFRKEKSSNEIPLENNCFVISARDLSPSIDGYRSNEILVPNSRDSFFVAMELWNLWSAEITGKFELVKLQPGIAYDIILIMLDEDLEGWEELVIFKFAPPGGVSQYQREIRDKKPGGEWVEIILGEFTREPHQIGPVEFSISLNMKFSKYHLLIKGVMIRLKA